ncbi:helix-turn-helix transcriptional regulator [Streptomyces ipomoeae]|uniref:helix-turn-helix transcriptional regulator n=1 Tax=Streptomyces ipomoeae TaxID=103232 RepID=UPI0029ABF00B|nr:helix-turn-helix transcriptional regulator [Streptomyces ipomoeae]MDX2822351.1 helix-turn-helix transcriptional regulator [Streptomyces ipomoeae]MDX2876435.1 helix-turn-helix transcriptional regulator [Streptomyces ipomoeae]
MSTSALMAAFWRPLRKMIKDRGVSRAKLRRQLCLSESALSELLNGKRATAPSWDVVTTILRACGEMEDSAFIHWRKTLTNLETELDVVAARQQSERPQALAEPAESAESADCSVCTDEYEDERFRSYIRELSSDGWRIRSFSAAARVLAGRRPVLRRDAEKLVENELESREELEVLRDSFDGIARRMLAGLGAGVRRACHVHRVGLLRAAHTILLLEGGVRSPALDSVWADDPAPDGVDVEGLFGTVLGDGTLASGALPITDVPYIDHRARLLAHYTEFAEQWAKAETRPVAEEATAVYEARLAELAADCPELFVWASMLDGPKAVRALDACPTGEARDRLESLYREVHARNGGLDGLEILLRALSRKTTPGVWPARLSEIYRYELNCPISPIGETGDDEPTPHIPRLAKGYVNPAFRTAVHSPGGMPHVDAWWSTRPLSEEIQGFLAAHLTGFPTVRPLIVLGDPGAGKSLLTRLLAARLPPEDYLPIRIELRNVSADVDILEQIRQALRHATLMDVTWATVTELSDGVLPVLIFDGFDELLQASGADHWRYLQDIADFQQASARSGLPVAAIVTSRTVVADQAKFPDNSVIIRLEPFDASRIARWTDTWNSANAGYFRRNALPPLRRDLGALYPDLAAQPLLLLMLALYFGVEQGTGPIQVDPASMSRVDLYERLLRLFVRRQIIKLEPRLRPEALEERIENELDLLSVIAAAMFNRGRQGVSAEEADNDLRFLRAPDNRAACPEAGLVFGRFFFIHEARATSKRGTARRWYEFLHATFGEHLVARKIARTLAHCPDHGPHDGLLFDLLSHSLLTDRAQIIDNLRDFLPTWEAVRPLFPTALDERSAESRTGYTARPARVTHRHACYSANLLLLALARGQVVNFSELTDDTADPVAQWSEHALLWKSQLPPDSWDAFTRAVGSVPQRAIVGKAEGRRDIALCLNRHELPETASRAAWVLDPPGGETTPEGEEPLSTGDRWHETLRRSRLLYDRDVELVLEPALPVFEELNDLTSAYTVDPFGQGASVAHALVALLLCEPAPARDLTTRYEACLRALDTSVGPWAKERLVALVSHRLAGESDRLPADFVSDAVWTLANEWTSTRPISNKDERTPLHLLSVACRLLARAPDEQLAVTAARLLALEPASVVSHLAIGSGSDAHVPDTMSTGRVLALLFRLIETIAEPGTRALSGLRLLKLAVALDQREWCDEHGTRVLDMLDTTVLEGLLPSEEEYVRGRWGGTFDE